MLKRYDHVTDYDFWSSTFGSLQNLIELHKVKKERQRVTWLYFYAFLFGFITLSLMLTGFYFNNHVYHLLALLGGASAFLLFLWAYKANKKQMDVIEEVLRVAQCQQQALDNHAIVSITNLEGRIVYANTRFIETAQYTKEELIGNTHKIVNSGYHEPSFFAELWRTVAQGDVWRGVVRNRAKDGSYYWVNSMVMPITDQKGMATHYISIRTDITAQKEAEEELSEAVKSANAASIAKSEFLANMSHEIRTPMNGVLGMLQLIKDEPISQKVADYVDAGMGSAKLLLRILNDVLDVSKIEAGKLDLEYRAFDWKAFLHQTTSALELQAKQKGLEFMLRVDENIPQYLFGDDTRIGQIINNLVGNALKFTDSGHVGVCCSLNAFENAEYEIQVEVSDSGLGISDEQQNKIFKAFGQADSSINRKFGGTGLGLSISKNLVQMMGGKIWLESEVGKGSSFFFTLKLKKAMSSTTDSALQASGLEFSLQGIKLLLVEDNLVNQKLAVALLKKLNVQNVILAENGMIAIEKFQTALQEDAPFDLILMDMQMPVMDGLESAQKIRQLEQSVNLKPVPIMALTANVSEADQQRCFDCGMNGFVGKPFKKDELYQEIARLLVAK